MHCPTCGWEWMRPVGRGRRREVVEYVPPLRGPAPRAPGVAPASACEALVQDGRPALPIPRVCGKSQACSGPRLLVGKYARASAALPAGRRSMPATVIDLDRSMLADWVGKAACALYKPLVEPLGQQRAGCPGDTCRRHARAGALVRQRGTFDARTGRLWIYLRDERQHRPVQPPPRRCWTMLRLPVRKGRAMPAQATSPRSAASCMPTRTRAFRVYEVLRRSRIRRDRSRLAGRTSGAGSARRATRIWVCRSRAEALQQIAQLYEIEDDSAAALCRT